MDNATLTAYLEVIESTTAMLLRRCDDRNLVRLEDCLATLAGLAGTTRMALEDPFREEYGRGVDGDQRAEF